MTMSNGETFMQVLLSGPTDIPMTEDINAALEKLTKTDELVGARRHGDSKSQKENRTFDLINIALAPVWFGLDALKWAGQTVNDRAVQPAIQCANPLGLAIYFFDIVKNLTPQRARDLARIIGNATVNVVGLLLVPEGVKARNSGMQCIDSFLTSISSPRGRQLVIDCAASFVKISEALDTPQTKDAVQQLAVTSARCLDLLASDDMKVSIQALADFVCNLTVLLNSREATVMVAEFAANVVHALEVEHNQHKNKVDSIRNDPIDPEVKNYEEIIVDKFNYTSSSLISNMNTDSTTVKAVSTNSKNSLQELKVNSGDGNSSRDHNTANEVATKVVTPRYNKHHFEKLIRKKVKPLTEQMEPATYSSMEDVFQSVTCPQPSQESEIDSSMSKSYVSLMVAFTILTFSTIWTIFGFYGIVQYLK